MGLLHDVLGIPRSLRKVVLTLLPWAKIFAAGASGVQKLVGSLEQQKNSLEYVHIEVIPKRLLDGSKEYSRTFRGSADLRRLVNTRTLHVNLSLLCKRILVGETEEAWVYNAPLVPPYLENLVLLMDSVVCLEELFTSMKAADRDLCYEEARQPNHLAKTRFECNKALLRMLEEGQGSRLKKLVVQTNKETESLNSKDRLELMDDALRDALAARKIETKSGGYAETEPCGLTTAVGYGPVDTAV